MKLSKSKYCEGIQCEKILWLNDHKPECRVETSNQSTLDNGTEVGNLAKQLFGSHIDIPFSEKLSEMIADTNRALENENVVITEASFEYQNCFCSIDILKKTGDTYEIYEVKSSTDIAPIYLEDVAFQTYVLSKNGCKISKVNIVHLNRNYVRKGALNLKELFVIEDVTDTIIDKLKCIEENIRRILYNTNTSIEPEKKLSMSCMNPYECPYFAYCTRNLEPNNVFKIRGMRNSTKFKLYDDGIILYNDLLKVDLNDKYKQQIEFELYDLKPNIDTDYIRKFLKTLDYPLYFLDFETYQQPIPEFDNVSPYMQIPFQYSLHYYEREDGELKHKEFLGTPPNDPRRELALQLVKDIPLDVCTVAYNMMFEKMVIKNLAELYPDLKEHLMNIYNNMHDLMIPFKERKYYTKSMQGSFSIKYVLPALFPDDESLNYHNLDQVHNGSEAMSIYAILKEMDPEERKKTRENLLKYCGLDTYAMVKIHEKLKSISR